MAYSPEGSSKIKLSDINELDFDCVSSVDVLTDPLIRTGRYEISSGKDVKVISEINDHDSISNYISKVYEKFPAYNIVRQSAVHLFRTTNVFYLCEYGTIISTEGEVYQHSFGEARYITPTKARLPGVEISEDGATFAPIDSIRVLDKAFVCMPLGSTVNYGHFITDCLLAIYIFADFLAEHAIPVVVPKLKRWQKEHLKLLDVQVDIVEVSSTMVRINKCFHSNIMDHFLHHISKDIGEMANKQLQSVSGSSVKRLSKIFLTRGDQPLRRFTQEDELAGMLKSYGFKTIQPELLPVTDQIAIFSQADVIIGATGAGFANVAYCKPGALIIEIMPESFRGNVWVRNLCHVRSCHWVPFELPERRKGDPVYYEGELREVSGLEYAPEFEMKQFIDFLMPFIPNICSILSADISYIDGPSDLKESLLSLALKHSTDKQGAHNYADRYEAHFGSLRNKHLRLLEIGIGGYDDPRAGGQSLRMWKDFFPNALIIGIDYYEKKYLMEDRIITCEGSQDDPAFLRSVHNKYGPFDIIIDDGSHMNKHILVSFRCLFPLLKIGGIYAIEDTQTSYWKKIFEGSSNDLNDDTTTMGFTKKLVDGLNHMEIEDRNYITSYYDRAISSIHFYHNQVFIYKEGNYEDSNVVVENKLPKQYSSYE